MELPITAFLTYESKAKDDPHVKHLVACSNKRGWMDATPDKFAYRCIPMVVSNGLGWAVLCPVGFTATWNGGVGTDAIEVVFDAEPHRNITSHFGFGILTFNLYFVFNTPPGVSLIAGGPANLPKHGISPLEGVVETSWLPFTFTMNWMFTAPGVPVHFNKGDPICRVLPYPHEYMKNFTIGVQNMSADPAFKHRYDHWLESRNAFHKEQRERPQDMLKAWQKNYAKGEDTLGHKVDDHRNTAGTSDPVDLRTFP